MIRFRRRLQVTRGLSVNVGLLGASLAFHSKPFNAVAGRRYHAFYGSVPGSGFFWVSQSGVSRSRGTAHSPGELHVAAAWEDIALLVLMLAAVITFAFI